MWWEMLHFYNIFYVGRYRECTGVEQINVVANSDTCLCYGVNNLEPARRPSLSKDIDGHASPDDSRLRRLTD